MKKNLRLAYVFSYPLTIPLTLSAALFVADHCGNPFHFNSFTHANVLFVLLDKNFDNIDKTNHPSDRQPRPATNQPTAKQQPSAASQPTNQPTDLVNNLAADQVADQPANRPANQPMLPQFKHQKRAHSSIGRVLP